MSTDSQLPRDDRRRPVAEARSGMADLIEVLLRRYVVVLATSIPVLLAVAALLFYLTPRYTSEVRMKIEVNDRGLDPTDTPSNTPIDAIVDTEIETIRAREVARAVATRLNLLDDPEFVGPANERNGAPAIELAANTLLGGLGVGREGTTYIVGVSYTSTDPVKAAEIANAFADEYVRLGRADRTASATEQAGVLDRQLDTLRQQVEEADAQIARYRAETGTVSGNIGQGTVTDQQIVTIAQQLAVAESDAAAARSRAATALTDAEDSSGEAISEVLASPTITDLRRQRSELMKTESENLTRYGPRHPFTLQIQQQMAGIDRELKNETTRIIGGLQSAARAASSRAASLRQELTRLQGTQSSAARAGVQVESLQRDADARRAIYNQLNQAAQLARQQAQIGRAQARIISRAIPPLYPSFPRKSLFAAFGGLLAVFVGTGSALLLEAIQSGFRTSDAVTRRLRLPVLVSMPELSRRWLRKSSGSKSVFDYVMARPMSSYAELLRNVRAELLRSDTAHTRVITITSALPLEGKTTFAISLARVIAESGDRVLLIDCDLRRRALGVLMPERVDVGLLEVIAGTTTLQKAVVGDSGSGLDILPLSKTTFTAKDVFSEPGMRALLANARMQYSWIIIDAPPVLAVADARILATLSDRVLLVVRWLKTPSSAAQAAASRLLKDGVKIAGVVLNRVTRTSWRSFSEIDPSNYGYGNRGYHLD